MKINIFALISIFSTLWSSLAANNTGWSVPPQLNPLPKALVEVLMKDVRVKAIDGALRTSERKKSLNHENVTTAENPLQENRNARDSLNNKTGIIVKLTNEPKYSKTGLLNAIILLIDDLGQHKEIIQRNKENFQSFPVQGFVLSCNVSQMMYLSRQSPKCDCNDLLKSNINSLLIWAEYVKEMFTSTLNVKSVHSKKAKANTHRFPSSRLRQIKNTIKNSWESKDIQGPKQISFPMDQFGNFKESTELLGQNDEIYENKLWNLPDMLTRIRVAFFRTLFNILGGKFYSQQATKYQEVRPYFPYRSNFHELAAHTLEELTLMPNEKGYMMVASTGVDELSDALELFHRYVSSRDSLLVITSTCPRKKSSLIPFFARGPCSERIANLRTLPDLPKLIHTILKENECRGTLGNRNVVQEDIAVPTLDIDRSIIVFDEVELPNRKFLGDDKLGDKIDEKPQIDLITKKVNEKLVSEIVNLTTAKGWMTFESVTSQSQISNKTVQ